MAIAECVLIIAEDLQKRGVTLGSETNAAEKMTVVGGPIAGGRGSGDRGRGAGRGRGRTRGRGSAAFMARVVVATDAAPTATARQLDHLVHVATALECAIATASTKFHPTPCCMHRPLMRLIHQGITSGLTY